MRKIAIDMNPVVHGSRAIKRCTRCMVNELINDRRLDIDLVYFDYKKQREKYLNTSTSNVREHVVSIPQRTLRPFWKLFSWPKLELLLSEYDIFYTNEFFFPPTRKTLVLATIHGLAYKIIPDKIPAKSVQACNAGLSYILDHADYFVAVSETTKKEFVEHIGVDPDRIYVITHGVDKKFQQRNDHEAVSSRLRNLYSLKRPFILYVGAIGIHKNIMGLLNSFNLICDRVPHDLLLVGPPDSAWDEAQKFIFKNNLSARVKLLGSIDQGTDDLADFYNAADLFVFPSFYEGWTSPPLEAMACGTPVIASNCSSLPETLSNAAILADPNDHHKFAVEIEKVLSDKALQRELIQLGLDHVAKHRWEKSAARLKDVFSDITTRGFCKK